LTRVTLESVTLRLRAPLRTAFGEVRERELLQLRLRGSDGVEGIGEAAPLEAYDGVGIRDVRASLEGCRPLLESSEGQDHEAVLAACREHGLPPQAAAAVDLALWDQAGKRSRRPVWALLSASTGGAIEVGATLGAEDRSGAAAQAELARRAGFRCVKVKVGTGDDAGRLAAVRAALGPDVALRIDANGAWDVEEALANLHALGPVGIELCEEPAHGVEKLRAIRASSPVAIAIDESATTAAALAPGVADAVCLKIARCGGITGLMADARSARAAGMEVYLASTYDGPTGIAAALHAAAALGPDRPCGLATLGAYEGLADPFPPVAGRIAVPETPGLGAP
jgi:L-alanine-DL-glutamate epimerase-like enolase superfamily enzyme